MNVHKQKGFSLIELMVSITIGLILLAGVLSIFFSSRVTFSTNERTARLQENGRVALDILTHDIRSAGYQGCARGVPFNNNLKTPTSLLWNYIFPVQGYENDGAGVFTPALGLTLAPTAVNDSDVVVVRSATRDGRSTRLEKNMTTFADSLEVFNTGTGTLGAGVYMISDCNAADIFQATSYVAGPPATMTRNIISGTPGNSTTDLGYLYQVGARIVPLQTIVYYVGVDATTGEPGLYRQIGTATAQLLIEGVQALQISYGEDTDNDRVANFYRSATNVVNWNNIISVNLSMLIRSEQYGTATDPKSYVMLTAAVGGKTLGAYNDRRQRMMFTTTAALRNRAW
ncbi:MAG: PilW family protein [Pseudomonadota bacterium]